MYKVSKTALRKSRNAPEKPKDDAHNGIDNGDADLA